MSGHADVRPLPWAWMLLPLLVSAATRGWWAPDEPRYAQVAREMFETGQYWVMHRCGEVYPDKPPLLFWLSGLLGWLSGWSEFAMRLVSIASLAGTATCIASLARRWWGPIEAGLAPAVFLGTFQVIEIGGRLQIDPLLTLLCTAALTFAWRDNEGERAGPSFRILLAGTALGLAALAKGPIAWVNVGLVWIAWRVLGAAPRWTARAYLAMAALALLPVLAWASIATALEPDLAGHLFFGQHTGRLAGSAPHAAPVWKHAARMPLWLLPWTVPAAAGLFSAWSQRRRAPAERDLGLVRAGAWLAVLFCFYSLIPPKRDLYLLPAYPAAALCAARWLAVSFRAGFPRRAAWACTAVLFLLTASLLVLAVVVDGAGLAIPGLSWRAGVAATTAFAGGAWAARAVRRADGLRWSRAMLASTSLVASTVLAVTFPPLDRHKSPRALARYLAERPEQPARVPCYGVQPEGYRFYGGVPAVVGRQPLHEEIRAAGGDLLMLARSDQYEQFHPWAKGRLRILHRASVGSRRIFVLGAADPRGKSAIGSAANAKGLPTVE